MTASVASKFVSGLGAITAKTLGEKVGIRLATTMLSAPLDFFLKMGLDALFGNNNEAEFKEIFARLDQLEQDIENAVGRISSVVEEAELENEYTRISTYYSNLQTAAMSASDITSGYKACFDSFFSSNTSTILDNLNMDIRRMHDQLVGGGANSNAYFDLIAKQLYQSNAEIYAFNERLSNLTTLYLSTLFNAGFVLSCIFVNTEDNLLKTKAGELMQDVHACQNAISDYVQKKLRNVPSIVSHKENYPRYHFLVRNKATDKVLGRYYTSFMFGIALPHTDFNLIPKEDGYYYLRAAGLKVGIDHYYGKSIRAVHANDSNHPNHLWKFVPSETSPNCLFRIVNKATGKALDNYHGKSVRHCNVDEHPAHLWEVTPSMDGNSVTIRNKSYGNLLAYGPSRHGIEAVPCNITINAGVYNPHLPVPGAGWNACRWHLLREGTTEFHNLVNVYCGQGLDYYHGKGTRFINAPSGHPAHLWKFEPTVVGNDRAYMFIRNKNYHKVLDHYYGKVIKGAGDSKAEGPHPNHIWEIE